MKLTFLGTGTSYGVPYIGCSCAVCTSPDPRDKRLRSSIMVEAGDTRILVDTTPDMRQQLLRAGVGSLTAILWTHVHNDHIIGLDDVRPISDQQGYIPGFADAATVAYLRQSFAYVVAEGRTSGGVPRVSPQIVMPNERLLIGEIMVIPLAIYHGQREILAYRFEHEGKVLIYATDCSCIPETTKAAMRGADVLVLDALRYDEHPAHFTVPQALEATAELQPERTFFTHIAHDLSHTATNEQLPSGVALAYDTQEVEL
jgi:phosphoribosyl 1,2-cyclic phosphate phosphodiesterase